MGKTQPHTQDSGSSWFDLAASICLYLILPQQIIETSQQQNYCLRKKIELSSFTIYGRHVCRLDALSAILREYQDCSALFRNNTTKSVLLSVEIMCHAVPRKRGYFSHATTTIIVQ
jgi:hypothetical protein